jgi:peptidoglycan/xylan/chitin deacetylase (PgdA/CDA1 family)
MILSEIARGEVVIMETIIPYLHIVSDDEVLHVKHLFVFKNIRQFKKDVQTLCRHYKPISLNDMIENQKRGKSLTEKSFLLTFDDGFREIHDVIAPILIEEGVPATFFLVQNFLDNKEIFYGNKSSLLIELCNNNVKLREKVTSVLKTHKCFSTSVIDSLKSVTYKTKQILDIIATQIGYDFSEYARSKKPYLTTEQVADLLKKGFTIGGHSIDHPYYSDLTIVEQIQQTISSVQYLRNRHSLNYGAFAFPHSDEGVSGEFFTQIFSSGIVDITFGTNGMVQSGIPQHIQRFSAEKPLWPISAILQKHKLSNFIHKIGTCKLSLKQ